MDWISFSSIMTQKPRILSNKMNSPKAATRHKVVSETRKKWEKAWLKDIKWNWSFSDDVRENRFRNIYLIFFSSFFANTCGTKTVVNWSMTYKFFRAALFKYDPAFERREFYLMMKSCVKVMYREKKSFWH